MQMSQHPLFHWIPISSNLSIVSRWRFSDFDFIPFLILCYANMPFSCIVLTMDHLDASCLREGTHVSVSKLLECLELETTLLERLVVVDDPSRSFAYL